MKQPTPQTICRRDYRPPQYLADRIELDFDLSMRRATVTARTHLRKNPDADPAPTLRLAGVDLKLQAVAIDHQVLEPAEFEVDDQGLTLQAPPDSFVLTTRVELDPAANTALEGLYQSGPFLLTQCEAEGFRKITFALDRPDVMSIYQVRMEADAAAFPVLLSNGNLIEQGELANGRHFSLWHDPFPKPSYLFALVAGDLAMAEDRFNTASGREVSLRIYAEQENIGQIDHAMASLKRAMAWDETRFGLEYDLDLYNIVVTNDFNMGAMENKSLNIFNSRYVLASRETATDDDFRAVEAVIGHEYFHNWTGNRVTCRDWFQLTLKEGLTVFRDQEFTSDLHSRAIKRIEDVRILRSQQFAEDAGPMAHPIRPESYMEINNFYTLTVYEKGSEVIRMQHTLLGEKGFRRGLDLYFERHDGQAVTCDDFVGAMADANDVDLSQFSRWYSQAGTPRVRVTDAFDADARRYRLDFEQSSSSPEPLLIPIRLGLLDRDGSEVGSCADLKDGRFDLASKKASVVFDNVDRQPTPVLLRGFSAPVVVEFPYTSEQLAAIVAFENDALSRFDASQRLFGDWIWSRVESDPNQALADQTIRALGKLLDDENADRAFRAFALRVPDLATLGQGRSDLDIAALHHARRAVQRELAAGLADRAQRHYDGNRTEGPYAPDHQQSSRRALRGVCLDLIACAHPDHGNDLASAQYQRANNMTDRLHALTVLVHHRLPGRKAALDDFCGRFVEQPLVMDKWFAVQATAPDVTTAELDALTAHPSFSLKNPNKVRSVVGVFSRHPAALHRSDGSGHGWLACQIIAIDAINPQVAARLALGFNDHHRLIRPLMLSARKALNSIAAGELSPDVREIVGKALAASEDQV